MQGRIPKTPRRNAGPLAGGLFLYALLAGCSSSGPGGASSPAMTPPPPANPTAVTLVASSDANDQLTEFDLQLQGVTLTSQSGHSVKVLSQSQSGEFMHLNGAAQPLGTASVPQDVYTSATVSVGGAQFTCVTQSPSANGLALDLQTWAYGYTPSDHVTVQLPAPLVVSGDALGIELKLLVSKSATYSSCEMGVSPGAITPFAITPTFSLTSFPLPAVAATYQSSVAALDGEVSAVAADGGSLELALPPTLTPAASQHVTLSSTTVFQGVTGPAQLVTGTFVNLDGVLQADGSLHASRIEVLDPTAVNMQRGPLLNVAASEPVLQMWPRQAQGKDTRVLDEAFNFGSAAYQVSGEFSNVTSLPFVASFTAANMVPGQEVSVSTPAFLDRGPYFALATTITLMPQTIDGTVAAVDSGGAFTVYHVTLASYDLFASLAVQQGQTTLLTNPTAVDVYADGDTQMLNSAPAAPGSGLRFYGLVFNDAGMLRMDCARISDGVNPAAPPLPTVNKARLTE